jgi:APA family basic amino acid/polyamine antiporter
LRTLSLDGLAQSTAPVAAAASAVLGSWGGGIVGALVLAALASSVCAMVITGPRVYLEMARDGVLLPLFARRTAGDRVPVVAAIAQSVWSSVLVLTGTFEQIVTYTGFAIVMFSGLAVASLFVLRRRLGTPATFSVPGYPLLPAAFLVCALLIAVASFRYAPDASLMGLALIAAGIPVRWMMRSASAGSSSSPEVRTINP